VVEFGVDRELYDFARLGCGVIWKLAEQVAAGDAVGDEDPDVSVGEILLDCGSCEKSELVTPFPLKGFDSG
jgi:hypothetical protein